MPPLRQPTAAKPLTILDIGDSLGEDLGLGLGYTMGTNRLVRIVQDRARRQRARPPRLLQLACGPRVRAQRSTTLR